MNKYIITVFLFINIIFTGISSANTTSFADNDDVNEFIQHMVKEHKFNEKTLQKWFKEINHRPSVITAISKPYEGLPWYKYKKLFVNDDRIQNGKKFLQENLSTLKRAEQQFGVPVEIITAIIGVETRYGTRKGSHPVFESLATLAFDYPARAKFFKRELEQFLLLAKEEGWDPKEIKGSYAGAMGSPQFISSSYRHYAIDFSGNGHRDLLNDMEDTIGSVANYFKVHGWKPKQPVAVKAKVTGNKFSSLKTSNSTPKPTYTLKQLAKAGVDLGGYLAINKPQLNEELMAFVSLETENGPEYWLGLENFYVITRYNHSNLYAMAVYDLSEKIKEAYLYNN